MLTKPLIQRVPMEFPVLHYKRDREMNDAVAAHFYNQPERQIAMKLLAAVKE